VDCDLDRGSKAVAFACCWKILVRLPITKAVPPHYAPVALSHTDFKMASVTAAATTTTATPTAISTPTAPKRSRPNILITGTPGTGKTSTASLAAETLGLTHIDCSKLVVEKKLYHEKNEEFDTYIIDDDALCDELEESMQQGG